MIILHVEDNSDFFNRIVKPRLETSDEIYHATTKESAETILSENNIDYVILDLAIPLDSTDTTPSTKHGQALATNIRRNFSGIPILILTGQSSEEIAQELEDDHSITYFWDGGEKNLVKVRKKRNLPDAIGLINEANKLLIALDNIELQYLNDDARNLTKIDKRCIRLFGKCNNAGGAQITVLNSGLSDSKVIKINLLDQKKRLIHRAIAKIDTAAQIKRESSNYRSQVTRLPLGTSPVELGQYYAGCGSRKGVFYQLAFEYNSNYFDVLMASDENATALITRLKNQLNIWHGGHEQRKGTIKAIRQLLCSDEKLNLAREHLKGVDWENFESKEIIANWSVQHGDLHGVNILVSDDNQPIIIDYDDINTYPSSLDPITLELSPFFHPYLKDDYHPSENLAELWFDDKYFDLVIAPTAARELRNWTNENAYLDREKLAVLYSYCINQLTYPDTNKDFAIGLIKSAITRFE